MKDEKKNTTPGKKNVDKLDNKLDKQDKQEKPVVLLNSREAAKKLGLCLPTFAKIRETGLYHGIPGPKYIMIGQKREGIRYIESELDEWILSLPRFDSTNRYIAPENLPRS